jgi:hypothetical protein
LGYQVIHGTKPQTLSYGLTDSPVGLAAWILEKYHGWCAVRGTDDPPPMDRDLLLANIMIYWLNGVNATTWIYRFLALDTVSVMPPGSFITVPTGLLQFPDDNHRLMPKQYVLRSYNEVDRAVAPRGGHSLRSKIRKHWSSICGVFSLTIEMLRRKAQPHRV